MDIRCRPVIEGLKESHERGMRGSRWAAGAPEVCLAKFLRDHLEVMELMARAAPRFAQQKQDGVISARLFPPDLLVVVHAVTGRTCRLLQRQPAAKQFSAADSVPLPRRDVEHQQRVRLGPLNINPKSMGSNGSLSRTAINSLISKNRISRSGAPAGRWYTAWIPGSVLRCRLAYHRTNSSLLNWVMDINPPRCTANTNTERFRSGTYIMLLAKCLTEQ